MEMYGFETLFPRSLTTPPRTGSDRNSIRNLKIKRVEANTQCEKMMILHISCAHTVLRIM
jgi:hypothetical protein